MISIDVELAALFNRLKTRDGGSLSCIQLICREYEEFRENLSIKNPEEYKKISIKTGRAISNICFDLMKHPSSLKLQEATIDQIRSGHIFFLAHRGGVCNRLRAIAALKTASEIIGFKFSFAWVETESCTGAPLPWTNFSNHISPFIQKIGGDGIPILLEDNPLPAWQFFNIFKRLELTDSWQRFNEIYISLSAKILNSLADKLNAINDLEDLIFFNNLKDYTALHIRRTDFVPYFNEKYPNDLLPSVDEYIHQIAVTQKEGNFFLSTDDVEVRNRFVSKFGKRAVFFDYSFDQTELRQTSFKHSILDLLMLSRAKNLILTPKSSFSEYAASISKAQIIQLSGNT